MKQNQKSLQREVAKLDSLGLEDYEIQYLLYLRSKQAIASKYRH